MVAELHMRCAECSECYASSSFLFVWVAPKASCCAYAGAMYIAVCTAAFILLSCSDSGHALGFRVILYLGLNPKP